LENKTKYELYVTGVNEFGESGPSLTASATTEDPDPAVMPKFGEIESRMMDRIETSAKETESRMMSYIESAVMPEFGETESRMAAYMEAYFDPKFNALADGQKLLRETMASKSRVEELEEEVAFLKPTVMSMLTDIDHLKKAQ